MNPRSDIMRLVLKRYRAHRPRGLVPIDLEPGTRGKAVAGHGREIVRRLLVSRESPFAVLHPRQRPRQLPCPRPPTRSSPIPALHDLLPYVQSPGPSPSAKARRLDSPPSASISNAVAPGL